MFHNVVSPSRTYVAICASVNGEHYCRKFILPEKRQNDSEYASWYFLNVLDFAAYLFGVLSFENYSKLTTVPQNEEGESNG